AFIGHVVGKYVLRKDGAEIKFCIDASDPGDIQQTDLLEWSDLYFKTNYWPNRKYPSKVVPLANVNPLVLSRRGELRALRTQAAEWDLLAFFRVWGNVEHNLALFESLARLKCRTKLLAYLISANPTAESSRLEKAGVPWTTNPLPLNTVWDWAARSRLNLVRHGVDDCVPWRLTEILAMGHCPVLDYPVNT